MPPLCLLACLLGCLLAWMSLSCHQHTACLQHPCRFVWLTLLVRALQCESAQPLHSMRLSTCIPACLTACMSMIVRLPFYLAYLVLYSSIKWLATCSLACWSAMLHATRLVRSSLLVKRLMWPRHSPPAILLKLVWPCPTQALPPTTKENWIPSRNG